MKTEYIPQIGELFYCPEVPSYVYWEGLEGPLLLECVENPTHASSSAWFKPAKNPDVYVKQAVSTYQVLPVPKQGDIWKLKAHPEKFFLAITLFDDHDRIHICDLMKAHVFDISLGEMLDLGYYLFRRKYDEKKEG